MSERIYTVYKGEQDGKIVYIGTTIQEPAARFRWHKANGKPFAFTVLSQHQDAEEMLAEELRLIRLHKPKHNKRRKQNLNVRLTAEQINARKGKSCWCQSCLRRRVSAGYKICLFCSMRGKS